LDCAVKPALCFFWLWALHVHGAADQRISSTGTWLPASTWVLTEPMTRRPSAPL
jgi:hypothetical protein